MSSGPTGKEAMNTSQFTICRSGERYLMKARMWFTVNFSSSLLSAMKTESVDFYDLTHPNVPRASSAKGCLAIAFSPVAHTSLEFSNRCDCSATVNMVNKNRYYTAYRDLDTP